MNNFEKGVNLISFCTFSHLFLIILLLCPPYKCTGGGGHYGLVVVMLPCPQAFLYERNNLKIMNGLLPYFIYRLI